MAISQSERLIRIATPLGADAFVVLSFSGTEEISGLFSFEVQMASEQNNITFDDLAGKNVTLGILSSDGTERYINGMVTAFGAAETAKKENLSKYFAIIQPTAWALTQCSDCRIFQDETIPDIIEEVLDTIGSKGVGQSIDFRMELKGSYDPREFVVQYNETDMAFISRLCETEGIFYYFEHEDGKHTMIFSDHPDVHEPYLAGEKETVPFHEVLSGVLDKEVIAGLQPESRLMTGKYTARDYNFLTPLEDMTVEQDTASSNPASEGEIYEYPGGYEVPGGHGKALAELRIKAADARINTFKGRSNCRGFVPGFRFTLKDYPIASMNGKSYVFTMVRHEARQHLSSGEGGRDSYHNHFVCLPHETPFRPLRKTKKPVIVSSQTAIVTGPEGEEIHTDEHGRVKVKFHWDRRADENGDGNMSCWIRVSQNWAGAKWGAMHIPRVDQEVIVNFLDGDPDRPIITGRVYHAVNTPPYDLPAEKTKSTFKSHSTKDGGDIANEIRFEDLKGEEEFYTHAAKDQNEIVENDMTTTVKHDQSITVEEDRFVTVTSGSEVIKIKKGMRKVSVKADEEHTNKADFDHTVKGDYTLTVSGNIDIKAGGVITVNGKQIFLN